MCCDVLEEGVTWHLWSLDPVAVSYVAQECCKSPLLKFSASFAWYFYVSNVNSLSLSVLFFRKWMNLYAIEHGGRGNICDG